MCPDSAWVRQGERAYALMRSSTQHKYPALAASAAAPSLVQQLQRLLSSCSRARLKYHKWWGATYHALHLGQQRLTRSSAASHSSSVGAPSHSGFSRFPGSSSDDVAVGAIIVVGSVAICIAGTFQYAVGWGSEYVCISVS
uniref:Uncharacterized protein n=1 Tax=Pristionchus pacificus TaxID=54126 RepID=A0A2A6CIA0_PRIPA|eukprot:PDM77869.1 hypothetical protein PRIPAC_34736 [Pristionchus pacificus]